MKNNTQKYVIYFLSMALVAGLSFWAGSAAGKRNPAEKDMTDNHTEQLETLQKLNRYSIENFGKEEGTIYVIGHKSPDSDTVCTAIAYARLLDQLGYDAVPMVSGKLNNETLYILEKAGVDIPEELIDASGENIFLVDHSEFAQAVDGMEDAHIVGVLDHHGIGNITTGHQVIYEAKPIGATATIVWLDYMNYGVEIDPSTAYLLLGAVLSDTANLTGSTVTEADRQAIPALAEIAGVEDLEALGRELDEKRLSYDGMSNEEIFFSDYKEYETNGIKYGIGLISVTNEDDSRKMAEKMKQAMPDAARKTDADLLYASVGIRKGDIKIDYIIPNEGESEEILTAAFPDYDEYDGTSYIFRKGLGRKTKFVPGLTEYLSAHPHE
ncbi:MAG: DHH family phosphoesterase [Solobacterium sp.]|nr:DHH family phosphoesterase [Solobacterium sp.]